MRKVINLITTFILIVVLGCEHNDDTNQSLEITNQPNLEGLTTLKKLPVHIQNGFLSGSSSLKQAAKENKGKAIEFGDIVPEVAIERGYKNGNKSYTLALEKKDTGFYYDNIALQEYSDGTIEVLVYRFSPTLEWAENYIGKKDRYESYSGSIEVFDENGLLKNRFLMEKGTAKETWVENSTNKCTTTAIIAIGCAYSCWISEITLKESCTGGGDSPSGGGTGIGTGDSPSGEGNLGDGSTGGGTGGTGSGNNNSGDTDLNDASVTPIDGLGEESWDEEAILVELAPDDPVEDLEEFLKCYDTSKPAVITVYANQPIKNSSRATNAMPWSDDYVGHAFISISQDGNTSTFGFYPKGEGVKAAGKGDSTIGNNGNDSFDVSISKQVSGGILSQILIKAQAYPSEYDLYNYNCTNYARDLGNLAGMNIPSAWGNYPTLSGPGSPPQGGQNPGKLGEVIRNMTSGNGVTINKSEGNAPSKNLGCN